MTIIISSVVGASLVLMGKGQIKGTEAMLGTLAQALEQYKMEHRMYVPPDDDWTTYPLWQAVEHEGNLTVKAKYKQAGDTFEDPRTGASVQRYLYIDAWRQEVEYYPNPNNSREFILRSYGPDRKRGPEDDLGDDIVVKFIVK